MNPIIAGNFDTPLNNGMGPKHPDVSGPLTGSAHNLISDTNGSGQTESVGTFHYMAPEIGRGNVHNLFRNFVRI